MKLSNRILIAFFGFIFIYLTAAFAEIRFRGNPYSIDDSNTLAETADINGATYLVLQDLGKNINVIGSDEARIEVRSESGDLLKKLKYNISGDTLTLLQFDSEENKRMKISVYVNNLRGMTVNGAVVTVGGLEQKVLSISQNAGRISMGNKNVLGKLHLVASNKAHFYMSDISLDTVSALLDNSEVSIYSPVTLLEGSMKNNTYLRINGPDEIQFKKDESSRLFFYYR